jgi:hypothetical protein
MTLRGRHFGKFSRCDPSKEKVEKLKKHRELEPLFSLFSFFLALSFSLFSPFFSFFFFFQHETCFMDSRSKLFPPPPRPLRIRELRAIECEKRWIREVREGSNT